MTPSNSVLNRLIHVLTAIRDQCLSLEQSCAPDLERVDPECRISARNLLHYLALRQHDLAAVQEELAALGLSSLGRMEAHTLAGVDAVLSALHQLAGRTQVPQSLVHPQVNFGTGQAILNDHTERLLGPAPHGRAVRIMVTMPSEAATDYQLVLDLLHAGMNVMRINCAHDGPKAWEDMIDNLRRGRLETGRACCVLMDLAGPKLRTGLIAKSHRIVRWKPARDMCGRVTAPARVWVTGDRQRSDPPLPVYSAVLPLEDRMFARLEKGIVLRLQDSRGKTRSLTVVSKDPSGAWAESRETAYVEQGTPVRLLIRGRSIGSARVGKLLPVEDPLLLRPGDSLVLTADQQSGVPARRTRAGVLRPAQIGCTLPQVIAGVRIGHRVLFDDGRIEGIVRQTASSKVRVEITRAAAKGSKLRSDKGINLPDTKMKVSGLTPKDLDDLEFAAQHADIVGLSFLQKPGDVRRVTRLLRRLQAAKLGVILKIENRLAFQRLPRMLLAGMESPPLGVMVARGDLAVEIGFERLAEVQEEILWLCEAAHVPVVWATQVLETLAASGRPSRAEVTDAAMAGRAECVMLNKGPHVVEVVRFLDDVLRRMQRHQQKKRAMLRKLSISEIAAAAP